MQKDDLHPQTNVQNSTSLPFTGDIFFKPETKEGISPVNNYFLNNTFIQQNNNNTQVNIRHASLLIIDKHFIIAVLFLIIMFIFTILGILRFTTSTNINSQDLKNTFCKHFDLTFCDKITKKSIEKLVK